MMVSVHRPWRAVLLTLIVCILIAPLVGGVVFFTGVLILPYTDGFNELGATFIRNLMPTSYFYGGMSAVCFSIAMSVYGWFRGVQPVWLVAFTTAVLFAVFTLLLSVKNLGVVSVLGLAHVVSAFTCWIVFRRFWEKNRQLI